MGKFKRQRGSKKNNKKYPPDPNKPDEVIVNESIHLLKLKLDELLTNSKKTRRYDYMQRNGISELEKPPRPQNAFVLYRRNRSAGSEFKNRSKKDRKIKLTSKEIEDHWNNNETDEVKRVFFAL